MKIRLQKILSQAGLLSRRAAEKAIEEGRVEVNGEQITAMGSLADPEVDKILLDGKEIPKAPKKILLLFHKPQFVVTTKYDPENRKTVMDCLPYAYSHLNPVGRLDFESEGLLLLTNDGEWANQVSHPRYEVEKEYDVEMEGSVGEEKIDLLRTGLDLEDGIGKFKRVEVIRKSEEWSWLRVVIAEGRNRFIRRMGDAIGHPVHRLVRIRVGPYELGDLKSGKYFETPFQKLPHLL